MEAEAAAYSVPGRSSDVTGMQLFDFVCYTAGLILFVLAAFNVQLPRPTEGRPSINLLALGLAFWILVPLVHLLDTL